MASKLTDPVLAHLWSSRDRRIDLERYAVLDGARDREILPLVQDSGLPYECLYRGKLTPRLAAAAPYLVSLPESGSRAFAAELVDLGWGRAWGIFLKSKVPLHLLQRQLRRFLQVRLDSGPVAVFRWYDPRVLRPYLPTCNKEELGQLFESVVCYVVEDEDPTRLIDYRTDGVTLHQKVVALSGLSAVEPAAAAARPPVSEPAPVVESPPSSGAASLADRSPEREPVAPAQPQGRDDARGIRPPADRGASDDEAPGEGDF